MLKLQGTREFVKTILLSLLAWRRCNCAHFSQVCSTDQGKSVRDVTIWRRTISYFGKSGTISSSRARHSAMTDWASSIKNSPFHSTFESCAVFGDVRSEFCTCRKILGQRHDYPSVLWARFVSSLFSLAKTDLHCLAPLPLLCREDISELFSRRPQADALLLCIGRRRRRGCSIQH